MQAAAGLDRIGLLASLSAGERAELAARCAWRHYRAGESILNQEARCRHILFVVDGAVSVLNYTASGRKVAYATIPAGNHVGEIAAIDGEPRSASVEAAGDCTVAALPGGAFDLLLSAHGQVAMVLLKDLARKIRQADERITELNVLGAMQRVYRELQRHARPCREGLLIAGLPTQESLAALAGTTRETVARAMARLIRSGIARRRGRELVIRDPERLEALILAEA